MMMSSRKRKLLLMKKKLLLLRQQYHLKNKRRRYWVHPINQCRETRGIYHNLIKELQKPDNQEWHRQYFRMDYESFEFLLNAIKPHIMCADTNMRKAIEPGLKLAITLHHLAEGASHSCIAQHYHLGRLTVSKAIYATCDALWKVLQPLYLKGLQGPDDWNAIAEGFKRWNFPNCLGSVDGKHITIQKPNHGGSVYVNYKSRESLVLMAVCDSSYKFTVIDIGQPGGISDGGVWDASELGQSLLHGRVNLPHPTPLAEDDEGRPMPYVFVGDEAFPLKNYLMRPFPGRQLDSDAKKIFNYRLSRCRRVIENTFGIMSQRWRILFKPIIGRPERVKMLVKAICVLHNYLRSVSDNTYTPPGFVDRVRPDGEIVEGFWHSVETNALSSRQNFCRSSCNAAVEIREHLCKYFMSPGGSISWQYDHINARR